MRICWVLIARHSSVRAHRVAIGFQPASFIDGRRRCSRRRELVLEVLPHRSHVRRALQSQGPAERASARRELEASRIGVQPGTPARHPAGDVHDEHGVTRAVQDGDHPQQGGPEAGGSTPHARADRRTRGLPRETDVRTSSRGGHGLRADGRVGVRGLPGVRPSHGESTPAGHPASSAPCSEVRAASVSAPGPSLSASERMSMRQPVSLAARRAFWPSLPIASESW